MHTTVKLMGGLVGLAVSLWLGTRVKPPRFKTAQWRSRDLGSIPILPIYRPRWRAMPGRSLATQFPLSKAR
jgi:hypothetical protein